MPAKKTIKARAARPNGKKGIAKKAPVAKKTSVRGASKGAVVKRSRKAPAAKTAARTVRAPKVVQPLLAEPLFGRAELEAKQGASKVVKKAAPVRPPRPPATLPIPQSTFFF